MAVSAPPPRDDRERPLQVPAEIDLRAGDLVFVVEGQDLGVPSSAAAGDVGLVGDDHLIARLDQPDELEVLTPPRRGPAPLEVAVTVELRVRRGGEEEVVAQSLFEEASVARCKSGIRVADDLLAVGDWPSLLALAALVSQCEAVASRGPALPLRMESNSQSPPPSNRGGSVWPFSPARRRAARRVRRSGLRARGRSRGGTCSRSRRSPRPFPSRPLGRGRRRHARRRP